VEYLSVKNWEKYQYRKPAEGKPMVWCRLYSDVLGEYGSDGKPNRLFGLPDNAVSLYFFMLAMACKFDNRIPADFRYIEMQSGRKNCEKSINLLIECGIILTSADRAQTVRSECALDAREIRLDEIRVEEETDIEEGSSPPNPPPVSRPAQLTEEVVARWNSVAIPNKLPTSKGGDSIRKLVTTRAKSAGWRATWQQALGQVPSIPFAMGINKRGWKANLIWFLRPETVDKILSGFYGQQSATDTSGPNDLPEEFR
jgi:hypothetical protein